MAKSVDDKLWGATSSLSAYPHFISLKMAQTSGPGAKAGPVFASYLLSAILSVLPPSIAWITTPSGRGGEMLGTLNAFIVVEFLAFSGLVLLYIRSNEDHPAKEDKSLTTVAGILFGILVVVRAPSLLSFYRTWAEINSIYFSYAYGHGAFAALVNAASNYFDISTNISSAIAATAGLQWWPVVDTGFGLLAALLFPLAVSGTMSAPTLRIGTLLAVATALYCVTASETFGTALHNKGWGPVYAALVFVPLAFKQPLNRVHIFLLCFLPFTGTPAALSLMVWAVAGIFLRQPALVRPLAWSLPGLVTQIVCALLPATQTGLAVRPFTVLGFLSLPDLLLLKVGGAILWPALFFRGATPDFYELGATAITVLCIGIGSALLWRRQPILLLVPVILLQFAATAVVAVGGAESLLRSGSGFRYYFPSVAPLLVVLAIWASMRGLYAKAATAVVCLYTVAANHQYNAMVDGLFFTPFSPTWYSQAADHLTAPSQPIQIYPKGWKLTLPACGEYHC